MNECIRLVVRTEETSALDDHPDSCSDDHYTSGKGVWLMGFFQFLKHGGKAAENVTEIGKKMVDGVGEWIDNRNFTAEEAAKLGLKGMEVWVEIQRALAMESTTRSITRRYLAWGIMGTFLLLILLAVSLYKIDQEYAKFILSIVKDTPLGWLVTGVGALYFAIQFKRT